MSYADAKKRLADVLSGIKVTNLVENPSFEIDPIGINADAGLSTAVSSLQWVIGSQSLLVTSSTGGANKTIWPIKYDGSGDLPASPFKTYTNAVWVKRGAGSTGNINIRVGLEWLDSGSALISREYGDGVTPNAITALVQGADWARKSYTAQAPANTAFVRAFVEDAGSLWLSGKDIHFDGWMLNEGGLVDYIDGTMPGCAWTGTAHASASQRALKRVYENLPGAIQDVPCFLIWPAGKKPDRRMGGWRVNNYEIRATLVAGDQDWDRAAAIIDAYSDTVISAFDSDVMLESHASLLNGPEVEPAGFFLYGAKTYLGADFVFRVRTDDSVTYAA